MIASLGRKFEIDAAGGRHALRMAFAAWLAFSIASLLHVHNAYWAAMPVWVVAQSSRGLLLERGFFRVLGTLLGAAAGFGMLQLTGAPYVLLVLLGLWVMLGAMLTHILRGVHSYGAMMAGMTAAVVVLPSVLAPDRMMALAAARVECTLIGVVVVTLVTGFFTPEAPRRDFYAKVRQLAADAVSFAAQAARGRPPEETSAFERRVLLEVSNLDASAQLVSAGSVEGYRRLGHVNALLAASIAVMAAGTALRARHLRAERRSENADDHADRLEALAVRLRDAVPGTPLHLPQWPAAESAAPEARLQWAVEQLLAAEQALFAEGGRADARSFGPKVAYLAPHTDWARALRAGVVSGVATFLAASAGLASGWPEGELAALGVCIFSMVLGSLPVPRMVAPKLLMGVTVGVAVAMFYRFAVQPHVAGPLSLVLTIIPFILLGALARVSKRTTMPALDANMCFMLASQAGMPAVGASAIFNGAAALVLAAALVSTGFMLVPDRRKARARASAAVIRQDLVRLLDTTTAAPEGRWHARTARQILRLLLDLQKTGKSGDVPDGMLAALNFGHAIADLQTALRQAGTDAPLREQLDRALQDLRRFGADPVASGSKALQHAGELQRSGHERVAFALRDAADALYAGAGMLRRAESAA